MTTINQDILDAYKTDIETCISVERFAQYIRAYPDIRDAVSLYMWNMAPSLQCLEITFRNAVHDEMTRLRKTPFWFDIPRLLLNDDARTVQDLRYRLVRKHPTVTASNMVSELTFGFWVTLYSSPYSSKIAVPTMVKVFQYAPKAARNQPNLSRRLNAARKLRNKAFHYEHIWRFPDLKQQYDDLSELISWMCPLKHIIVAPLCRFDSVYTNGPLQYRPVIDSFVQDRQGEADRAATATVNSPAK